MLINSNNKTRYPSEVITITLIMLNFIGLMVLILLPFQTYTWASEPFPGFVVEQTFLVGVYSGEDWRGRSKVEHLQQILFINDNPVNSHGDYNRILKSLQPGQMVKITISNPDGSISTIVDIPIMDFPRRDLIEFFWLPYGIGLVYYLLGLWVFFKRMDSPSGQAFSFFCLCTALASGLLFDIVSNHVWVNLWSTVVAQLGGALIILGLLFPEPFTKLRNYKWFGTIGFGISLILTIWSAWVNYDTAQALSYVSAWSFSYIYAAAGVFIFIILLILRLRLSLSPEARQQVLITLWGAFFSFSPMVIWFLAPTLGVSLPWNPVIFMPLMVVFPFSIGFAIVRYRLWDLEIIINRTLVYSLLSLSLISIFILGVVLVDGLILGRVQERSPYSIALSSMAIALVFTPMRNRIQRFIDRRFFRTRYDAFRTIESFSLSARQMVDLNQIETGLQSVLRQTIQPARANLYSFENRDQLPDFYIENEDPLRAILISTRFPLDVEHLVLNSPALEKLRKSHVVLTIPLIRQGELIGVINLGKRLSGQPYTRDDQHLLQMLAAQVASALRVAQLVQQYQAQVKIRQRIDQEMELARQVQESVLQSSFPKIQGFSFAARNETARQVGGDFYNVISIDEDLIGLVVADVSDKGIPAALYMAMTRSLMVSLARSLKSPEKVMLDANEMLQELSTSDMFVTIFYAVINRHTLSLCFSRAGHEYPILIREGQVQAIRGQGMALGVLRGDEFFVDENELQLQHGDRLVMYTDGLTDVMSSNNIMFGLERLTSLLCELSHLPIQEFCDAVFSTLTKYRGSADLFDDMTLLVVDIDPR